MNVDELPRGAFPKALPTPHFPTRAHAVVWRNWGLVPPERLAETLAAPVAEVARLAHELGLPERPDTPAAWLARGTNTLIRNNWHLLPYKQLLTLLGWTPERLDFALREDDYLWVKLGHLKPDAAPVRIEPATDATRAAAARFRADVTAFLPDLSRAPAEAPFAFLADYASAPSAPAARPPAVTSRGFGLRLAYSYTAPYGDVWLHPELDPYPDGLLARYADAGINAVWLPAILYTLVPLPGDPSLSVHADVRRDNLARLAERIRKRGLELILYLNEPHAIPLASPLWDAHPDWRGVVYDDMGVAGFCTSVPGPLAWTRDAVEAVFRAAPALGGFFTINMSEFPTHCHSRMQGDCCPRCRERPPAEVVVEAATAAVEGARAANPDARAIVWTWAWRPEWELDAVDLLPDGVTVQCVSEWGLACTQAGVDSEVVDYSISHVGPSERSKAIWARARARGLEAMAKVQINTTWEQPAVPYLPTPTLVDEHLANLQREGVGALMVSWTVGGFPGGNAALLDRSADAWAEALAGGLPEAKADLLAAWTAFADGFRHFPFSCQSLYMGPHSVGPANLWWAEPTGYAATMVQGLPYDDLAGWRDVFPEDGYAAEWRAVADGWARGLAPLARAAEAAPAGDGTLGAMARYAEVAYAHFRSASNQIEFVRLRERLKAGDADARAEAEKLFASELAMARRLFELLRADSRVAFESANHYAYTANDLAEKAANLRDLARRFGLALPAE